MAFSVPWPFDHLQSRPFGASPEALEEQTQLLRDQLDLFSYVPGCEKASKETVPSRKGYFHIHGYTWSTCFINIVSAVQQINGICDTYGMWIWPFLFAVSFHRQELKQRSLQASVVSRNAVSEGSSLDCLWLSPKFCWVKTEETVTGPWVWSTIGEIVLINNCGAYCPYPVLVRSFFRMFARLEQGKRAKHRNSSDEAKLDPGIARIQASIRESSTQRMPERQISDSSADQLTDSMSVISVLIDWNDFFLAGLLCEIEAIVSNAWIRSCCDIQTCFDGYEAKLFMVPRTSWKPSLGKQSCFTLRSEKQKATSKTTVWIQPLQPVEGGLQHATITESMELGGQVAGFDRRFAGLLKKINHRAKREEALQTKLKRLLDDISFMLQEPEVVREDL